LVLSPRRILEAASAKALLTSKKISPILWSLVGKVSSLEDILTVEKVAEPQPASEGISLDDAVVGPDDTCFLQFTSGSTSDPKGVVVTHANLLANARAIMFDGLESDPERDRGVSWLPLYHDMGLIGFVIAPLLNGVPVVFIPTLSFVKRPNVWIDTISKYRGTITFAPNFAFGLAAKRATPKRLEGWDLSCLRVVGCGAEPINADTMRAFVDVFSKAGFDERALMPAYGMAEATLAMSFDDLQSPIETVTIDRELYESEHRAVPYAGEDPTGGLVLVSCGKTFPGHQLGVMGPDDTLLDEGQVGELVFSGPSVTPGYFGNPGATGRAVVNGWLHTGDLGFILDGHVYVSGRMKDIIILNGRNYYPQSFEWEVEQIDGVRRGNVVAFAQKGEHSEDLVIVAETKIADPETRERIEDAIRTRIQQTLGVRVGQVALVGAGALPKTSSGKLQRNRTKLAFGDGSLGRAGDRTLGSGGARLALAKHITSSAVARLGHHIKRPARTAKKWVSGGRRNSP
jgi:acyl-CoA synthetase (AMP-forming)/AMP-acid ligase II